MNGWQDWKPERESEVKKRATVVSVRIMDRFITIALLIMLMLIWWEHMV